MGFDKKTADIFVKIYAVLYWIGAFFSLLGGIMLLFGGSYFASMIPMGADVALGAAPLSGLFVGIAGGGDVTAFAVHRVPACWVSAPTRLATWKTAPHAPEPQGPHAIRTASRTRGSCHFSRRRLKTNPCALPILPSGSVTRFT